MNSISQIIAVINGLEKDGIIERYAIGGAVGATFYIEPVATLDVDIFVVFRQGGGSNLLTMGPIFDYLTARGGVLEREYVVLYGWPVQFIPPTSPLVAEAIENAVIVDVEGVPAKVFTAEHLAAIALETGRPKDMARLLQFIECDVLDMERFQSIISRHGLSDRWNEFRQKFLSR